MASASPTASTADALRQAVLRALDAGDHRRAGELCRQLVTAQPQIADGWFLAGMAAAAGLQPARALRLVDRAVALAPEVAEYLAQKAKLHTLLNQPGPARAAADRALASADRSALTLDTLGVVYTRLGAHTRAREVLAEAAALAPDNPQFLFNLGSAEQFLGHADAAARRYRRAIELRPDFHRARWALAELDKASAAPSAEDVATLEALLAQPDLRTDDELYLCHALAIHYEKAGDYARAFATLARGKRRRVGQISYAIGRDERLFDAVRAAFAEPRREAPPAEVPGKEVVFVVGMPRTGTTLVESILGRHPALTPLGELQDFALAVKAAAATSSRFVLDEGVVRAGAHADPVAIGADYLQRVRARLPGGGRFIDKMPLNFLYLGWLLDGLPNARVVCVRRGPLDTCLANFRQLFAIHYSYYNYHYDLGDTAGYYVLFDRLMAHWQTVFGARIHELRYESLVADPEAETRRLLQYLELPWHPACLQFHEAGRAVTTASAMQVRQPLYRYAVGRWEHYREHLGDAITVLDRHGIRHEAAAG